MAAGAFTSGAFDGAFGSGAFSSGAFGIGVALVSGTFACGSLTSGDFAFTGSLGFASGAFAAVLRTLDAEYGAAGVGCREPRLIVAGSDASLFEADLLEVGAGADTGLTVGVLSRCAVVLLMFETAIVQV